MNAKKYNILPNPKTIVYSNEKFDLTNATVCIGDGLDYRVVNKALKLRMLISQKTGNDHSFYRVFSNFLNTKKKYKFVKIFL